MDIRPLFMDMDDVDPLRGATTRAIEYIIQFYMESEDYRSKCKIREDIAKRLFYYLAEKDKEGIKSFLEMLDKEN